jgi:hypothetical protein
LAHLLKEPFGHVGIPVPRLLGMLRDLKRSDISQNVGDPCFRAGWFSSIEAMGRYVMSVAHWTLRSRPPPAPSGGTNP